MYESAYVYIISNKNNTTLYVGVTSNLKKRIYEHKTGLHINSFSSKYNLNKLVYFEIHNNINQAIEREKQIKGGSREKKLNLINSFNPSWYDLFDSI